MIEMQFILISGIASPIQNISQEYIMRKNICFLIGSFQTGGAENHVYQILQNIDLNKYNPHIAVINASGNFENEFRANNFPIYIAYKKKNIINRIFKYFSFIFFLRNNDIDLIHIHLQL